MRARNAKSPASAPPAYVLRSPRQAQLNKLPSVYISSTFYLFHSPWSPWSINYLGDSVRRGNDEDTYSKRRMSLGHLRPSPLSSKPQHHKLTVTSWRRALGEQSNISVSESEKKCHVWYYIIQKHQWTHSLGLVNPRAILFAIIQADPPCQPVRESDETESTAQ